MTVRIVALAALVASAACARDVDATPDGVSAEIASCSVDRTRDACRMQTSSTGARAFAVEASRFVRGVESLSGRILRACRIIDQALDPSSDRRAPVDADPTDSPAQRAVLVREACATLAARLRRDAPEASAVITSERCEATTADGCPGEKLPFVSCSADVRVTDIPTRNSLDLRDEWDGIGYALPRLYGRLAESERALQKAIAAFGPPPADAPICDATALTSGAGAVNEWSVTLGASADALSDVLGAVTR